MPVRLETAHLVLVQSTPLSIRFRDDEKQFDVDGAYNARYEIVKKRIDKATVKETGERPDPARYDRDCLLAAKGSGKSICGMFDFLLAGGYLTGDVGES